MVGTNILVQPGPLSCFALVLIDDNLLLQFLQIIHLDALMDVGIICVNPRNNIAT